MITYYWLYDQVNWVSFIKFAAWCSGVLSLSESIFFKLFIEDTHKRYRISNSYFYIKKACFIPQMNTLYRYAHFTSASVIRAKPVDSGLIATETDYQITSNSKDTLQMYSMLIKWTFDSELWIKTDVIAKTRNWFSWASPLVDQQATIP